MSEIKTINENTSLTGDFRYEGSGKILYRHNGINYHGQIHHTSEHNTFEVLLNGKTHFIKITSELDELIEEMGLNVINKKDAGDIFSPMPGLVIEVLVEENETVEEGQPLLILEAMKMENIIKSTGSGKIEDIKVEKGQKIDKGELLVVVKPVE